MQNDGSSSGTYVRKLLYNSSEFIFLTGSSNYKDKKVIIIYGLSCYPQEETQIFLEY